MSRLKTLLPFNEIFYLFLFALLIILCIQTWYWIFFLSVYLLYLIKFKRMNWIYGICGAILGLHFLLNSLLLRPIKVLENMEIKIIDNYKDKSYIGRIKNKKILLYTKNFYELGDILRVSCTESTLSETNLKELFNYKEYLNNRRIVQILFAVREEKIGNEFTLKKINQGIEKFFMRSFKPKTNEYLNLLLIGNDRFFVPENYQKIQLLNASHLLCISGLHLNLIILILQKLFELLKIKEKYSDRGLTIFLILFSVIVGFTPSVLRVTGCYLLGQYFKRNKLEYTSLDLLCFVGLILFLWNPLYAFNLSFQLSFLVSFGLILSNEYLQKCSFIKTLFMITIISNLITLPIVINLNNQINFMGILANVVLVLFFSYVFLPLTFGILVLPFLEIIYLKLILIFEHTVEFFAEIDSFIYFVPNLNFIEKSILITLIFFILKGLYNPKNRMIWIICLLLFFLGLPLEKQVFSKNEVIFFDVGQGDSSYYEYNGCRMLIDFYGSNYEYIYKKGHRNLDYLILSHGHDDHFSDLEELLRNLKFNKVMVSAYDQSPIIQKINELQKKYQYEIIRAKRGDLFTCKREKFEILNPSSFDENLNNISLVFQLSFYNKKILYTGDIEKKVELEIANYYKILLKSDLLKVAHHGSKTSSSKEFLAYVLPKISIITLKEKNIYGFPGLSTLKNLNNIQSIILMTYQENNIRFDDKKIKIYFP